MRVAFLGNHGVSYSTESHVAEALESVGCEVFRIQEGTRAKDVPILAEGSDIFLWTKTPHLSARAGTNSDQAKMLKAIKKRGILTTAYHLDRYWDLRREKEIGTHPWWSCDVIFSADGGNQERFATKGIEHRWLPAGLREAEVGPGQQSRQFTHDVVFVGSGAGYHPEWPWRQELLAGLQRRYRRRFAQYPKRAGRPIRGQALNDLYASARVIVGDSIFADRASDYWSDRIYETVGRGGALVHPFVEGLDAHFAPYEHYMAYQAGSLDSVYDAVDALLTDEPLRQRMKFLGPIHVRESHTYRHRMTEMLASLGVSV